MDTLLDLAFAGIEALVESQNRVLAPTLAEVEALRTRGRRRAAPKDEKDVWGPPG